MMVRYHGDPVTVRCGDRAAWKLHHQRRAVQRQVQRRHHGRPLQGGRRAGADFRRLLACSRSSIGCLGLFGLAAFTAERRTKEIGIRKVLGARTRDIVRLLVWQFSRPVIIANIIAWPVAWWLMRDWLNGFDQRIALAPVPFVAAGVALGIAIATVVGHAMRVARANPIYALRYE